MSNFTAAQNITAEFVSARNPQDVLLAVREAVSARVSCFDNVKFSFEVSNVEPFSYESEIYLLNDEIDSPDLVSGVEATITVFASASAPSIAVPAAVAVADYIAQNV